MAKKREVICEFYICEGECRKGRDGTFQKKCQTCDKYVPLKGAKPKRLDHRRKKRERIFRKENRI